jgi:DNA-binding XRE family transcriptional regulator
MEIYERIRELRKNHLKMSMEAFGKCLGVSRDTINNIERNRLSRPEQKMPLYKLICSKFKVNEEWLLNGIEPMFVQPNMFSLDDFVKENGATELELKIVKTYFELDSDIRKAVIDHFKSKLSATIASKDTEGR